MSRAADTVYLKWARIDAEPMAMTFWQTVVAFAAISACQPVFEDSPRPVERRTCREVRVGPGADLRNWCDRRTALGSIVCTAIAPVGAATSSAASPSG
jgi:hypothetical protein